MRLLVDARPLLEPGHGGVTRVARALVAAYADRFPEDEIVLATTGMQHPQADILCHYEEIKRNHSDEAISSSSRNSPSHLRHLHLTIPNKLWSLASVVRAVSFDRVFEHRSGSIVDAVFLPNLGFVGTLTKPYVLLLHDLSFLVEPQWFTPRVRLWHNAVRATRLITKAAHLLAVSETTKNDAMRLFRIPSERITVIPIGDTIATPSQTIATPQGRYVLALGARDPRKNAQTAIAAVEELKKDPTFADLELVLLGDKKRPNDDELRDLYQNASAFLYPSWYEGYGLPLHEAATFGTPCIASTAGALPETAPQGTVFVEPAKPHHWASALHHVLLAPRIPKMPSTTVPWTRAAEKLRASIFSLNH